MIKTPSSTVIGGAGIWTPGATILGSLSSLASIIKSIFANNEQGSVGDLSDLSTLFQDEAGTIPVTGAGQLVGLIKDKSGRNNHAFQTTSGKRPILKKDAVTGFYYIETDGVDDFLQTNSVNFTATDAVTVIAAIRGTGGSANNIVAELSSSGFSMNGSFGLRYPGVAGDTATFTSRGTAYTQTHTGSNLSPPQSLVLTGSAKIATNAMSIRANGVAYSETLSQGGGKYGNYPIYIGMRAGTSLPFTGRIYGWVILGRTATSNEISAIEKEFAKRAGVTLSV